MMQQQPPHTTPVIPSFPSSNITTDQIQKYLDDNKKLILAILDNQNLGKLAECAQYQALLQRNLMYLAAIADAQPPAPTVPSQVTPPHPHPHPAMQQGGGYLMQHPQAAAAAAAAMAHAQQQPGTFPQKAPLQFNNPHQLQEHQQMGMRPNNGMMHHHHPHPMQPESGSGGGNKQDASESGTSAAGDGD